VAIPGPRARAAGTRSEERQRVLTLTVEQAAGRVPVVATQLQGAIASASPVPVMIDHDPPGTHAVMSAGEIMSWPRGCALEAAIRVLSAARFS
jgi:hypothetical protein